MNPGRVDRPGAPIGRSAERTCGAQTRSGSLVGPCRLSAAPLMLEAPR